MGTTAPSRAAEAFALLMDGGAYGVTVVELRNALDLHHGAASAILSHLHREGRIARLAMTRQGAHVYVLPAFVRGRPTERPGRGKPLTDVEQWAVNDLRTAAESGRERVSVRASDVRILLRLAGV